MKPYRSPHAGTPKIRDYDNDRKLHLAEAVFEALLVSGTLDGQCYISTEEVMDAFALVGGQLLASHPNAKVPSKRREMCGDWAKNVDKCTQLAMAGPSLSSVVPVVVLTEERAAS